MPRPNAHSGLTKTRQQKSRREIGGIFYVLKPTSAGVEGTSSARVFSVPECRGRLKRRATREEVKMGTQQRFDGNGTSTDWQSTRPSKAQPRRNGNGTSTKVVKSAPRHSDDVFASERSPVTNFLGWFSIGLGLAEVVAPQAVARIIGVDEDRHSTLLRAYGIREIAAGVGILTRPKPTYWMWNRVMGDAVDLASLGRAMQSERNDHGKLRMATAAVLGVMALDIVDSVRLTSEASPAAGKDPGSFTAAASDGDTAVTAAVVTVNCPIEEVYEFWKNPRNYAQFMDQLDSVNPTTGGKSRFKIKAPPGLSLEWDSEIVQDIPNELIRWAATDESSIDNTGIVRFQKAPGNRGTIVTLLVEYKPKAGALGAAAAKFFSAIPKTQMANDLRRFKQLIEIGEVVKSDSTAVPGMHPAQPPEEEQLRAAS
jgi:uncharacterized membrane protein